MHEARTEVLPAERPAAEVSADLSRGLGLLERLTRAGLLVALVFFGVWTLCYQLALVSRLGATPTLALSVLLTAAVSYAVLPAFVGRLRAEVVGPTPWWQYAGAGVLAVVVIALALRGQRGGAITLVLLGCVAWAVHALRTRQDTALVQPERDAGEAGLWLTGWFWALACGVFAAVVARPDGDDAYFLNLSEWVADRGTFPLGDTMLSNEDFPALGSHSPPVHSFEGLLGALGWLSGLPAGVLTYVVAPPVLTVLAVLALTWLVSVCRVPYAPLALTASVVFLLMSGSSGASYGNFFAVRIWQGKSVLASIVIPLVIALAIEYLRYAGWRRLLVFSLAVVSTVGASNTAVFLVPVLLGGVVVAAFVVGGVRRAAGAGMALLYPLACGLAVVLLAPEAAPPIEPAADVAPSGINPLVGVPGRYGLLMASLLGLCVGWLGLRSRVARAVVICISMAASVALLPPVTEVLSRAAGVGGVIWRMWWVVPVPMLVGAVVGAAAGLVGSRRLRPVVVVVVAAAVAFLPLYKGRWIGASENNIRWVSPLSWKTPLGAEAAARLAVDVSREGDVVLAPNYPSRVLAGMTVDVHPVAARLNYLVEYAHVEEALVPQRAELMKFANGEALPASTLEPLLEQLSVDTVCLWPSRTESLEVLQDIGYTVAGRSDDLVCVRSAGA